MKSNSALGVIGGVFIAASAFLTGNTITFSGAAIVAATIALIQLVDMVRGGSIDLSVRFIILLVGVVQALFSSLGHRKE